MHYAYMYLYNLYLYNIAPIKGYHLLLCNTNINIHIIGKYNKGNLRANKYLVLII